MPVGAVPARSVPSIVPHRNAGGNREPHYSDYGGFRHPSNPLVSSFRTLKTLAGWAALGSGGRVSASPCPESPEAYFKASAIRVGIGSIGPSVARRVARMATGKR